jgi:hypothetical protein
MGHAKGSKSIMSVFIGIAFIIIGGSCLLYRCREKWLVRGSVCVADVTFSDHIKWKINLWVSAVFGYSIVLIGISLLLSSLPPILGTLGFLVIATFIEKILSTRSYKRA